MRLVFYNLRLWLSNQTKDLLNLDEQIKYILEAYHWTAIANSIKNERNNTWRIYIFESEEEETKYLLKVCTIENLDKMGTKNVRVT